MRHDWHVRRQTLLRATLAAAGCLAGCTSPNSGDATAVTPTYFTPVEGVGRRIQEALIVAQPGDVIELGGGTFHLDATLSLDVSRVVIRGQGPDTTILSFAEQKQGTGGEGLLVTQGGVAIEDLAIEDAKTDALKVSKAEGVAIRRVRTEWTGGAHETNGAYGIYPVQCRGVLVEDCVAIGASDAGIYVGQSQDVVVRRCRASGNVLGIEIENCTRADVYENAATGNAGGILIVSLPNLPAGNGRHCRVFANQAIKNNHANFAPAGNLASTVSSGTGIMVVAYDAVEIFENTIENNRTVNLAVVSYLATGRDIDDPKYDPYPERIGIYDNRFSGGGQDPQGRLGALLGPLLGGSFPDIVYDGMVDPEKLVDGELPDECKLFIQDNGPAEFVNFDLANFDPLHGRIPSFRRDVQVHAGRHEPLAVVQLPEAVP